MKTLKEALFSKKNLDNKSNKYGITEDDMIGELKGFPVGVVVRMMEEQEAQGNEPNVKVFQEDVICGADENGGGFDWRKTEGGQSFWHKVIDYKDFYLFFEEYPEYDQYNYEKYN